MAHLIDKSALVAEIEKLACQEYNSFCDKLLDYINTLEVKAERDLELTWEDIEKITDIWDDLHEDEAVYSKTGCDTPEFYQEILKQFKERKEK